jgi:hypothetical protein
METTRSSETSVYNKLTLSQLPEDWILHSLHRENLKSYTAILLVKKFCTVMDHLKIFISV